MMILFLNTQLCIIISLDFNVNIQEILIEYEICSLFKK